MQYAQIESFTLSKPKPDGVVIVARHLRLGEGMRKRKKSRAGGLDFRV